MHRSGAEEYPAQQDQMEGDDDSQYTQPGAGGHARQGFADAAPQAARRQPRPLIGAIERAPDEKGPADSVAEPGMPQAAHQEDNHDIDGAAQSPGAPSISWLSSW